MADLNEIKSNLIHDIAVLEKMRAEVDPHYIDIIENEDGTSVIINRHSILTGQINEAYDSLRKLRSYIGDKKPSPKYTNKLTEKQKKECSSGLSEASIEVNLEDHNTKRINYDKILDCGTEIKSFGFDIIFRIKTPAPIKNADVLEHYSYVIESKLRTLLKSTLKKYGINDFTCYIPKEEYSKLTVRPLNKKIAVHVRATCTVQDFEELKSCEPVVLSRKDYIYD